MPVWVMDLRGFWHVARDIPNADACNRTDEVSTKCGESKQVYFSGDAESSDELVRKLTKSGDEPVHICLKCETMMREGDG